MEEEEADTEGEAEGVDTEGEAEEADTEGEAADVGMEDTSSMVSKAEVEVRLIAVLRVRLLMTTPAMKPALQAALAAFHTLIWWAVWARSR